MKHCPDNICYHKITYNLVDQNVNVAAKTAAPVPLSTGADPGFQGRG